MIATRKVFQILAGIFAFTLGSLYVGWDAIRPAVKPVIAAAISHSTTGIRGTMKVATRHSLFNNSVDFRGVISQRIGSVVQIQLIARGNAAFSARQLEDYFLPENLQILNGRQSDERDVGSGIIISADGFIVTARHLLARAHDVHVILNDGTRMAAEIVGSDPESGVAVLKVAAKELPVMPIDQPARRKAGQLVIAIGSPMSKEFRNSTAFGVVSAMKKNDHEVELNYWLTDTPLNPGNSGGPLISSTGAFLGMANVPILDVGPVSGFGVVVSSEAVLKSSRHIISKWKNGKPRLGIQYGPVDTSWIEKKGAARIVQVEPGSSASEAGLRRGDIILAVNGALLKNHLDLSDEIDTRQPGDIITLTIQRGGDAISMQIRLKADNQPAVSHKSSRPEDIVMEELGFAIDTLTRSLMFDLEIPVEEGVVVLYIDPSSKAYREGDVRGGAVIVEMDGKPIRNKEEFFRTYSEMEKGRISLLKLYHPHSLDEVITALWKPAVKE